MRLVPVRAVLIAAALIAAAPVFGPQMVSAQTRPAPDTPGEPMVNDGPPAPAPRPLTDAVRVLVVTSGIIGGFVAADLLSGGVLTAPLLSGVAALTADAAAPGARLLPRAAALRPIIVAPLEVSPAARLPEFRQALGRSLARGAAVPPPAAAAAAVSAPARPTFLIR